MPLVEAEDQIFGLCLLNDWSARDHQFWEMNPLGPFLGKNFCTSVSPWIVTMEALAPYRVPAVARPAPEPQPLAYLDGADNRAHGGLDIQLAVGLETARHRAQGLPAAPLSRTSFRHQYWTIAQMVTQHTVGGCNLQSGDLLGTGTISGPTPTEAGAMVELSQGGRQTLTLAGTGETRTFLEDGDTVILRGWCEAPGAVRIGFGECRGTVLPAVERPAPEPQPLAYLDSADNRAQGGLDIQLAVGLETERHRTQGLPAAPLSRTSFRHQYWTLAQMVTQHTVGGCNLQSGDLLGTGTISGPTPSEAGAMVELSQGGRQTITLAGTGETRTFLEDGDTVILSGWCEAPGAARIGFGECRGTVLPAVGSVA